MATVDQVMEKAGSTEPQRTIEAIREAFVEMALQDKRGAGVAFEDIIDGQRQYPIPAQVVGIVSVSVFDTEESSELISGTEDRYFDTGTTNWTDTDFASFGTGSDLSVTNDAANQSCYLNQDDIVTVGERYRLRSTSTITSGTFELQTKDNSHKLGYFVQGTDNVIEFTAPETSEIKIVGISSAGTADFDSFSIRQRGIDKYRRAGRMVGQMGVRWGDHEAKGD